MTCGLWDKVPRRWSENLRAPRSPLPPSVTLPGVTSVQAGVLEIDGRNSSAYFVVNPLSRGVRASFFGAHPNRFLSMAIKLGEAAVLHCPPSDICLSFAVAEPS